VTENKASVIIHPARLRILQTLVDGPKTTYGISSLLPDILLTSPYRHLKILLDGEPIIVDKTHLDRGIEDKVYKISRSPRLSAEDLAGIGAEEHLGSFTTYVVSLLQDYSDYLELSPTLDLEKDRVGYGEVMVWATNDQPDEIIRMLHESLMPLLNQRPGKCRHRHKFAVITHLVDNPRKLDDRARA
jgi:hypothetical protein